MDKFLEEFESREEENEPMRIELAKSAAPAAEKVAISKEPPKAAEASDDAHEEEGQLAIDVYQTDDYIVIESTIAGTKKEDLDIYVTSDSVTIKGNREKPNKAGDEDYFYQECYWGKFSRSVILPQEVDSEKATSSLKNGVLTIKLPKLNRQLGKKVRVSLD